MMRSGQNHHRALLLAVGAALTVSLAVRLPHLSTGEIDFDEGVYWLSLRSLRAGNPLFTSVYSSQPAAFLLLTEPPWAWLGGSIEAARTVMLGWSMVAIAAGGVIGWRLGGRMTGVALAVLLATDPRMVDQSLTLQADGPAASLALLALAAGALAVTVERRRWRTVAAACAGAALALGVLTKLFDVGAVPALLVLLLSSRHRWASIALAAAGAVVMTVAVLLPVAGALAAMWTQAIGLHIAAHSLYPGISVTYVTLFLRREWPLAMLAAAGCLVGWRHAGRAWIVGLAWLGGAAAALMATRPVFQHHSVLLVPGMAILAATAIAEGALVIRVHLSGRTRLAVWSLSALAATAVCALLLQHALAALWFPTDTALVARLRALTPAASEVFGDDQFEQALAPRDAPPQLVDTSGVRLHSADVTVATIEGLLRRDPRVCAVLFKAGRLAGVPGLLAWTSMNYPERHELPGGAVLYTRPGCIP